ncbi:peptidoglycan DD-metalloendopeptidase family protein [Microbacterium sp. NPDC055683]
MAHVGVAAAAALAIATGAGALAVAVPTAESAPVAAVSIAAVPEVSDDHEVPESPTAGFSDAAAQFAAGSVVELPELASSSYGATTMDELTKAQKKAREALIRSAIESGLDVDLSRLDEKGLTSIGRFLWPVKDYVLTDQFGARNGKHMGMDIAAAGGTPITAASPGVVVVSSEGYYGYGVAVIIQHVNGVQTLYGHMTYGSRVVEEGDWVEAGDPIGQVGNTGHSFGDHLHFEVRVKGVPVDPRIYLDGAGTPDDVKPWTPTGGGQPAGTTPSAVPSEPGTPTTAPPTTAPGTPKPSAPGTPTPTSPSSPSPSPSTPPTTAPPTTAPPTTAPPTTAPPTTAPPTTAPPTTAPPTTAPPETSEPTQPPATTEPPAETQPPATSTPPAETTTPAPSTSPSSTTAPSAAPLPELDITFAPTESPAE